jgi:hypothetical protein
MLTKKSRINSDAWSGALSCCRIQELFLHSWGLFLLTFSVRRSALRDYTSSSLFAPDVRIHDAQHPRCQKNCQHDFHFRPYLLCLLWPRQIFSNLLWRLHFNFHIISINPCFIAGYNSFQENLILTSAIQKFWTDGSATLCLILSVSEVMGQTLKLPDAFLILS